MLLLQGYNPSIIMKSLLKSLFLLSLLCLLTFIAATPVNLAPKPGDNTAWHAKETLPEKKTYAQAAKDGEAAAKEAYEKMQKQHPEKGKGTEPSVVTSMHEGTDHHLHSSSPGSDYETRKKNLPKQMQSIVEETERVHGGEHQNGLACGEIGCMAEHFKENPNKQKLDDPTFKTYGKYGTKKNPKPGEPKPDPNAPTHGPVAECSQSDPKKPGFGCKQVIETAKLTPEQRKQRETHETKKPKPEMEKVVDADGFEEVGAGGKPKMRVKGSGAAPATAATPARPEAPKSNKGKEKEKEKKPTPGGASTSGAAAAKPAKPPAKKEEKKEQKPVPGAAPPSASTGGGKKKKGKKTKARRDVSFEAVGRAVEARALRRAEREMEIELMRRAMVDEMLMSF